MKNRRGLRHPRACAQPAVANTGRPSLPPVLARGGYGLRQEGPSVTTGGLLADAAQQPKLTIEESVSKAHAALDRYDAALAMLTAGVNDVAVSMCENIPHRSLTRDGVQHLAALICNATAEAAEKQLGRAHRASLSEQISKMRHGLEARLEPLLISLSPSLCAGVPDGR